MEPEDLQTLKLSFLNRLLGPACYWGAQRSSGWNLQHIPPQRSSLTAELIWTLPDTIPKDFKAWSPSA